MTRRQFSREFKREAVHLVLDRGVSVAQAARDLDLRNARHGFSPYRFRIAADQTAGAAL